MNFKKEGLETSQEESLVKLSEEDKKKITEITLGIKDVPEDFKEKALADLLSKLENKSHPLNRIYRNEGGDISTYIVFDDNIEKGYIKYFGTDNKSGLSAFSEIPNLLNEAKEKGYTQLSFHGWNKRLNNILTRFGFEKRGTTRWAGNRIDYYAIDLTKQNKKEEEKTPEFYQQKQLQKIIFEINTFLEKHIAGDRREKVVRKVEEVKNNLLNRLSSETEIELSEIQKANLELKLLRYFQDNEIIDENVLFDAVQENPKRLNTTKDRSNIENLIRAHRNASKEQRRERQQLRAVVNKIYTGLKDISSGSILDIDIEKFANLEYSAKIHFLNKIFNSQETLEDKKATISFLDKKFNLSIFSNRVNPYEALFETDSGKYYLAKLLNADHLEREGEEMHHCIGDKTQPHIKRVETGKIEVFSFRTTDSHWPLVTIEYNPRTGRIEQIKKAHDQYLSFDDEYYGELIEALEKLQETIKDDGEKRRITSINTSELENIKVSTDHVATGRGEIPTSDFDPENDFVLKIGDTTEKTSDERFTEIMNKKNGTNYEVGEIARRPEDINENTRYYEGDLNESHLDILKNKIKHPFDLGGSLILPSLKSADGLTFPTTVGGNLNLENLQSADGVTFPTTVGGFLDLRNLKSANGVTFPETVGGRLYLENLQSADGVTFPETVGGGLYLENLQSADEVTFPETVGGVLYLNSLQSADGVTFPATVGEGLDLQSLQSADGATFPRTVGGFLDLRNLKSANGVTFPTSVGGDLYLQNLQSADGATFPRTVGEGLYLNSLKTIKGLELPESVTGDIYLYSLSMEDKRKLAEKYPQHAEKILAN